MLRFFSSSSKNSPNRPDDPPPPAAADDSAETDPFLGNPELAELDRLYQQALDVMEAVESGLEAIPELQQRAEGHDAEDHDALPVGERGTESPPAPEGDGRNSAADAESDPQKTRITPRQVIEAALFVGGTPLTTRKLCSLLQDEFDADVIEQTVDEINRRYAAQNRPYEIRFGEGGYRMALRADFDAVRNRVFGYGPREIKLSQEALEILSVVAYKQPVTQEQIEQFGKRNAGTMLRQLLRRELISIERNGNDTGDVAYRTSPRFLQVFGLAELAELPQAGDLEFK